MTSASTWENSSPTSAKKSLADVGVWAKDPSYIRWTQSSGVHYKYASLHDTLARCGTIALVLSEGHTESFRVPARMVAAPAAPQPAKKRKAADVLGDLKNPAASKKRQVAACGRGLSCVCGKVFRDDNAKEQHLSDSSVIRANARAHVSTVSERRKMPAKDDKLWH